MILTMSFRFGDLTFDTERRLLLKGRTPAHLSPKAFRLLEALIERRPRAVSKEDLMDALWPETLVAEATLAAVVSELRAALGDDARSPRYIRTVHGFGYAFEDQAAAPAAGRHGAFAHRLVWGAREIELNDGVNEVGRDPSARVFIADGSVSRRHARLLVEGGDARLEDLASKNATWRGTVRVRGTVPLADGDELRFGTVGMTYRRLSVGGSTVTRASTRG
jgi:DNA-binding winged helix-turn-helix (wHTH) protein